jgi:hypothetical protein
VPEQADQVQVGVLWQVDISAGWMHGPLQTPLDQRQDEAAAFTSQSDWVAASAQSSPYEGFVMHPGVAVHPGRHEDPWTL